MRTAGRNKLLTALAFTCLIFAGLVRAKAQSVQWWPEVDVTLEARHAGLLVPMLIRIDSKLPNPQFVAAGLVANYRLNRNWSVSGGYLYADLPQNNLNAHVPIVAVAADVTFRRWTLADTNRFERLLGFPNEPYRYRNRATADYAFGPGHTMHVFAANEYLYNLTAGGWNQNRAQAGIGRKVGRTRVDAYFMERNAPGGKQTAVIGTVLTVKIGRAGR